MAMSDDRVTPSPKQILSGAGEPIFRVLPAGVLANMVIPGSENALLWNLVYPLAQPTVRLVDLLGARPLWGTPLSGDEFVDELKPYFWGYSVEGERLEGLDAVLARVDGQGPRTEIDLYLRGANHLVVAEVKNLATPGRCSRYAAGRCPEIHIEESVLRDPCRYWEQDGARFETALDFGQRPVPGNESPPCDRHYQLGRTLLVGLSLAQRLGLTLHLWLVTPSGAWSHLERGWLDFASRVRDESLWRRLRVLPWEEIQAISRG